jgi:hypothetical protein
MTTKARRTQNTRALWIRVLAAFVALLIVGSTLAALLNF